MPRSLRPIVLLLAAAPVLAQELPRLREVVDVTVANIEVIVTDADGKRVRGLASGDFELVENGKPVRITNFAEIDENVISIESSPAPDAVAAPSEVAPLRTAPVRRVVVFVDIATVTGIRRKNAIAEVGKFLEQLGPDDERMIVSWDGVSLKVEIAPEAERSGDTAALEHLARRPRTRWRARSSNTRRVLQTIVTTRRDDLHRSVLAVRALLEQMKPLDGRKVLVLVTAGFPLRPGRDMMIGPNFDEDTHAVKLYDGFAIEARNMLRALGDAANAAGVTLHAIHGFGAAPRVAVGPLALADLSSGGPGPAPAGGAPRTKMTLPGMGADPNYVANSVDGLTVLAEASGGTVTARTNDLARAFREIKQDLTSYYSLGYHLSGDPSAERNVEVRMRDTKLTARARTSIVIPSPADEAEDALLASLALPESPWGGGPANELGISATAGRAKTYSGGSRVAVDIRIPLAPLSWEEAGEDLVASVKLFIGGADAKGLMTEVETADHTIRIPRAVLDQENAYYTYVFDVDLRTRTASNDIAVAVVDEGSGLTGHALVKIGSPPR